MDPETYADEPAGARPGDRDGAAPDRGLGDQVADRLARELFSGTYRPGDLLPKEVELVERFGVSRASVRTGLQSLASRGIVRRVVGQGTVVQDFRDWNILDPVVTRWLVDHAIPNPDFIRDIFAFRHAAEPMISAIAAANAGARDLLAMEEAFEGMERCVASPTLAWRGHSFTEYDVDFHAAIYRGTRNAVWAQLAHILRPALTLVVRQSNDTTDDLLDSLDRHRRLMESIRLRNPARAFEAALHVMQRTAQDLGIEDEAGNPLVTVFVAAPCAAATAGEDHAPAPLAGGRPGTNRKTSKRRAQ